MDIWIWCLLFVVGIVLVVKGGDVFVDGASNIAKMLKVPSFIIGATIVSLATTMPEMIVSVTAAAQNQVDMAIGNAVGSVTANTALIMAIGMVSMAIACERKKFAKQISLLIIAAIVIYVSCLGGRLNVYGAIVLAIVFVLFMVQNVLSAKQEAKLLNQTEEEAKPEKKDVIKNIIFFVVGAVAIVFGSRFMVDYGSKIATYFGIEERIIAVTLVAVGTSLPELVTTITAIVKKESGLSIGNVIGANIIDLSLILPISSLVAGQALPVAASSISLDLPACLIATLIATIPLLIRQKSSKIQGAVLLAAYVAYLVLVIK